MMLEQLESLVAITETGSFRAAGERLKKAQSAVSYNIKTLEEKVGVKLFSRDRYRVQLTREGRAFLPKVKSLLRQCKQLSEMGSKFRSDVEPHFRLNVTAIYDFRKFCAVLNKAKKAFPDTDFDLSVNVLSGDEQLMGNRADFAIADNPIENSQLDFKPIDSAGMPVVASPALDFPACVRNVAESPLMDYPQIVVKSLNESESKTAGIIEDAKIWEVTDLHTKKELIMAGLGWGRMPLHMISGELERKQLVEIKIPGAFIKAPLSLVRRRGENHGRVPEFFWNELK